MVNIRQAFLVKIGLIFEIKCPNFAKLFKK